MSETDVACEVSAKSVIAFLRENPSFFDEHAKALKELGIKPPADTLRFKERELKALKERESQQQARLDIILDSARANLQLEQGLNNFAAQLIADSSLEKPHSQARFCELVGGEFSVDAISFVTNNNHKEAYPDVEYETLCQRVSHLGSVCDDRLASALVAGLFDSEKSAGAIRSCAFLPLANESSLWGVMVMGSTDEKKFQPGFGVMFLDRLAQLASAYFRPECAS